MKGDNDTRMPDYLSLNLSIALPNSLTGTLIGLNGTVSLDRYGSFHISPLGISIAKSASYFSGSLTGNWLMQSSTPSQEQLSNFLTEHAFNLGGGFIIGGGVSYTPGSGGAYGVGLYSPQFGASYNYTPTSSFYNPTSNFKW